MDFAQIKQHNSNNDCWIIINGKVYDVTKYLDDHPGGSEIIMNLSGGDATREFDDIGHSKSAVKLLEQYEIGVCNDYKKPDAIVSQSIFQWLYSLIFPKELVYLTNNGEKKPVTLLKKEQLTRDTIRLTFIIPGNMNLGIKCGQHIVCYNDDHQRKYTPTKTSNGEFELVVKVYPDGKLGPFLNQLTIGDTLFISGPAGKNLYHGNGDFSSSDSSIVTNNIMFICAGSGITPIYAILNQIANYDKDGIYTKLLFVNKTEEDIILRKELDELSLRNPNMENHYSLTQPTDGWKGLVGRPSKTMISEFATDRRNEIVVICGSKEFNDAVSEICLELGYNKDKMILF
jgi:NAD(P)H-flavin reductase